MLLQPRENPSQFWEPSQYSLAPTTHTPLPLPSEGHSLCSLNWQPSFLECLDSQKARLRPGLRKFHHLLYRFHREHPCCFRHLEVVLFEEVMVQILKYA